MPRPALSLAIVGCDFPNKRGPTRRFELSMCAPGEPIELRPEPTNPADENAIAVFSMRGIQLGYLTAERAPLIGKAMRDTGDVVAIFQEQTKSGALIRASFDGLTPDLPSPRPPAPRRGPEPEPVFYPDEEWPDE